MRRRSYTGPILLLGLGVLFLWKNLHPEAPVFELLAQDWPFLLIGWGLLRLIEIAFTRDEAGTGHVQGLSGGEIVLVILICLVGAGLWQAHRFGVHFNTGGLQWFGEQYEYPVSATADAKGIVRIVVDNPRGSLKVTGGDGAAVTVTGRKVIRAYNHNDADRTNGVTPVELTAQGDRLLIRTNQDRAKENQRVSDDLEIMIPRGVAVEARGGNGDTDVSDIAADVEVAGSRGDVRLNRLGGNVRVEVGRSEIIRAVDIKGKVDVQGRGSDIEMENIAGQVTITGAFTGALDFKNLARPLQFEGARNTELTAQAVPGRINMDMSEVTATGVTGPLRLMTGSRDVRLHEFTQSLDLETQRGDIELQPSLPMPKIEARSGSGRIELIVPGGAAFQLDATAERGDTVNDYGAPLERESEGRSATLRGKVGSGPTVRLTASGGSIEVRKEGTMASEDFGPSRPRPKMPKPPRLPDPDKM